MPDPQNTTASADAPVAFFRDRFGVDASAVERALGVALERRLDASDLYFEYGVQDAVVLEEGIVKSGERHVEQGVGVRVQTGERQGYAHSDEITTESLVLAAKTARAISESNAPKSAVAVTARGAGRNLYPVATAPTDVPIESKIELLGAMDVYARARDPRVKQVMASVVAQHQHVLIATHDGNLVGDVRPLVRLNIQVIAADGAHREIGYQGTGGRYEIARLFDPAVWKPLVDDAVRIALLNQFCQI
jgi:TldD protein